MSIARFTPRSLSQAVRLAGDGHQNFLSNAVFAQGENHTSQIIDFGAMNIPAHTVPYTLPAAPAVAVGTNTGAAKTVKTPRIRLKKIFDENKANTLNPALDSYIGPYTDPRAQIVESVNIELASLRRDIDRAVELQCCEALHTGSVTVKDELGTTLAVVSMDYTGNGSSSGDSLTIQPTLSGDDLWSADTSNPGNVVDTLCDQIRTHSPWGGQCDMIMGLSAWMAFYNNAGVREEMDTRNLSAGSLAPVANALFKGYYHGCRVFQYSMGYFTKAGVWVAAGNDKKLVMMPQQQSGLLTIEHGAVFDRLTDEKAPAQNIVTDFFSKFVTHEDPPVTELIVETRPLALIKSPKAIRVLQVLAA